MRPNHNGRPSRHLSTTSQACDELAEAAELWTPRLPRRISRGVRLERHPPNQIHGWVFRQAEVWVDFHGNEHDISSLSRDYTAAIIVFCQRRANRLATICMLDALIEAYEVVFHDRNDEQLDQMLEHAPRADEPAIVWLERSPFMVALRHRLDQLLDMSDESRP
jgi:hypothetical protein